MSYYMLLKFKGHATCCRIFCQGPSNWLIYYFFMRALLFGMNFQMMQLLKNYRVNRANVPGTS